jgi:hypothetical protein
MKSANLGIPQKKKKIQRVYRIPPHHVLRAVMGEEEAREDVRRKEGPENKVPKSGRRRKRRTNHIPFHLQYYSFYSTSYIIL